MFFAYPTQDDICRRYDEGLHPEIFNYFCLHGHQIFIERYGKSNEFKVYCRGWRPVHHKVLSQFRNSQGFVTYDVVVRSPLSYSMRMFRSLCVELLTSHLSMYTEYNPLLDTFLMQEEELERIENGMS